MKKNFSFLLRLWFQLPCMVKHGSLWRQVANSSMYFTCFAAWKLSLEWRVPQRDCLLVRFAIVGFDATVWPANSNMVTGADATLSQTLSMSASHVGFVQYPQMQSQTSSQALLKHKHLLEKNIVKQGLTCHHNVQILYTKPESTAADKRPLSQPAMAVFHGTFQDPSFLSSGAIREGKVGPCPLLRVADFIGFDDETRPSPSARIEQNLDLI